jgi:CubicO group peptidase (beta-lactamase class C family)
MKKMTSPGGLSKTCLGRLREVMTSHVEAGDMPGLVTLVSRHGEIDVDAIGKMTFGGAPMQRDTIFRITSMTKPVTAAAAMILVEECKIRLDDAVDRWLPELVNRKVLRTIDAALDDTVPAKRAITLRDLLTFRLGYGMIPVFPDRYPIQKAIAEAGFAPGPVFPSFPPDELMRRYGGLPLIHQPGERWLYNSGTEILGVLIARVAGTTLRRFLSERIFEPLGMLDTAFSVPGEQARSICHQLLARSRHATANGLRRSHHRKILKPAGVRKRQRRPGLDRRRFPCLRADDAQRRPARQRTHFVPAVGGTDDHRPHHAGAETRLRVVPWR